MNTRKKANQGHGNVVTMTFFHYFRHLKIMLSPVFGGNQEPNSKNTSQVSPRKQTSTNNSLSSSPSKHAKEIDHDSKRPSSTHMIKNNKVEQAPTISNMEPSMTASSGFENDEECGGNDIHIARPGQGHISGNSSAAGLVWTGNVMDESNSRKAFQTLVVRAEELGDPLPTTVSSMFPQFLRVGEDGEEGTFDAAPESSDLDDVKEGQMRNAVVVDRFLQNP